MNLLKRVIALFIAILMSVIVSLSTAGIHINAGTWGMNQAQSGLTNSGIRFLEIAKIDPFNQPLAGAEFEIFDESGNKIGFKPSSNFFVEKIKNDNSNMYITHPFQWMGIPYFPLDNQMTP